MYQLLWIVGIYLLVAAAAFVFQRKLLYFPNPERVTPAQAGLGGIEEISLKTPDGETLLAWFAPPRGDRPTLLYFHGNGGNLASRANRARQITSAGYGLYMLSYRGYGGSTGSPSEEAFMADAGLAYEDLTKRGAPPGKIVIYGESLGTGVATQLAARREARLLILESPFTSAVDVGARAYWFLPVRLLMADRFDSLAVIKDIDMPLLVLHGEADRIVPVEFGQRLFDAAGEPKMIWRVPGAGHEELYAHGAWEWIDERIETWPKSE